MEVILLEDVQSLGKKDEIVQVSNGYARSLINKKLCLEATAKNKNDLKLKKVHDEKIAVEKLDEAKHLAEEIEQKSITLMMKVGEGGKLFGAVSSKEIAKAVQAQAGLEIDKKKIQVSGPIKTLGDHEVTVKLHPKVTAKLKVKIIQET